MYVILDSLRVHRSKPVETWLEESKIKYFYMPSYSSELNPEERLNSDLRQTIRSKVQVRTKEKLRTATNDHMMMLESNASLLTFKTHA